MLHPRTASGTLRPFSGCSAAWLARHVRDVEVAGSNPAIPTIRRTPAVPRNRGILRVFRGVAVDRAQRRRSHDGCTSPRVHRRLRASGGSPVRTFAYFLYVSDPRDARSHIASPQRPTATCDPVVASRHGAVAPAASRSLPGATSGGAHAPQAALSPRPLSGAPPSRLGVLGTAGPPARGRPPCSTSSDRATPPCWPVLYALASQGPWRHPQPQSRSPAQAKWGREDADTKMGTSSARPVLGFAPTTGVGVSRHASRW